ncbi:DedA family protein [Microbacterium binotii]|jgi:membrane protein DedA with SNARE-associated domain|uniref:DedA family protein n=1 Tax=Microbacterium binotii TaxID=462710 RepID=A0ABN3PFR0_9MICO
MNTATLLAAATAPTDPHNFTGIVGFGVGLMQGIGEWGVGVFTFLETVFPPIPSELILPLAGFLTHNNGMNFWLLVLTSTLGAYLGAVVLYALGAWAGLERSIRWLARLPLVDRSDFDRAAAWFSRHSRSAVFFGRLVPGVRSLISLPAGAERMNFWRFSVLTVAGSGIWNALLIGGGVLLGTQYDLVEQYSNLLSYVVYAAIVGGVIYLVIRHFRRSSAKRHLPADDTQ